MSEPEEFTFHSQPKLLVVMPVYNEQAGVKKVILEWFQEIDNWTEDFIFLAINDGSVDETGKILTWLQKQLGKRLEVITRENRGHGQTCLQGYQVAIDRNIPYVFQIDSDGQCDSQYFFKFWRDRIKFDVIYGNRVRREDGWQRILASHILKLTLLLFGQVLCVDANTPYRLMLTGALKDKLPKIPSSFFLANVAMAVLLKRDTSIRHGCVPIVFGERYGGEPSVKIGRFLERALELISQLKQL